MKRALFWTIVLIIAFPFFLNLLMQCRQILPFVGEAKDWLSFWGSYLSAAIAAIMIIYTGYSLKVNKRTLEEMKHEWEEENHF